MHMWSDLLSAVNIIQYHILENLLAFTGESMLGVARCVVSQSN